MVAKNSAAMVSWKLLAESPTAPVYVQPGQVHVSTAAAEAVAILGSCVAVCLWDPYAGVAGMNHFMLPTLAGVGAESCRHGTLAMRTLHEKVLAADPRIRSFYDQLLARLRALLRRAAGAGVDLGELSDGELAEVEAHLRACPACTADALGRLHDLQVLQTHVAAVQALPPSGRQVPAGGLDVIAQSIEAECRHLHARYLSASPALAELCETVRHQVAPQLAAQSRRRAMRPLKMALSRTGHRPVARRA